MQWEIIKKEGGYITLLSVLIISAIGLAISVSLLLLGSGSLQISMNLQQSNLAKAYANECSEEALLKISENSIYAGSGNSDFGNGKSCNYTVIHGFQNETIDATGIVLNTIRKTHITLNTSGFLWQEIP